MPKGPKGEVRPGYFFMGIAESSTRLAVWRAFGGYDLVYRDRSNNPLKNAPHTVEDLVGEWDRPYSREAACFPAGAFRVDKYWPPVNRVDNVFGDRNLVCSCPPMDAYVKAAE
jgi:hypothetical protein